MNLSSQILSDITVFMKYSKYLPELNRRETWDELVTRNMNMHIKKFPELTDEIHEAYEFVYDKKVLPSMRSMQFAGKPIEISPNRIYNCAYLPIDHSDSFSEVMFLLLGGTGVGYSVQRHHIDKLPEIRKPNPDRKRRFLISDSIEGWADAIKNLMRAYFEGRSTPVFDYSDIRPKGARLVTSGGKAPGPQPLKDCIHNLTKILDSKNDRDKLTPLEVHDMICYIADAVLAGGIRRAALISLFSFDDEEMATCKYGNWWELNPQRGRSNNSAVILRSRVKKREFIEFWEKVKLSGAGEPGIYFSNDKDWGTNPCCEIGLRPYQFCVSGDTRLITRTGIVDIKSTVGEEIDIWNGEQWSTVTPYQTGTHDRLHRVHFSDGSYLDATDNHKFLVKNRFQKKYQEVETLDLIELLKTSKYSIHVPKANIQYHDGKSIDFAYEYGFVLGDGYIDGNCVMAGLYNEDKNVEFSTGTKMPRTYTNWNGNEYEKVKFQELDTEFTSELKYSNGLPNELFNWNRKTILEFIAGWADADGAQASNGIRIWGKEDKLRDAQLLLTKCGIYSSIRLCEEAGTKTNLGVRLNDLWYLQITKTIDIPCKRLICDNKTDPRFKGKYQTIHKIETLDGYHESYCLTEDELHQCVFNNVLTKQCNLCEVNVSDVVDQNDLNVRAKAAAFIGTLQAGYTDFHYLRDIWKRTTEKDALIGVGMTGIASGAVFELDLIEASNIVKEENKRVAAILDINPAARTTTVKPSGCMIPSTKIKTSKGILSFEELFELNGYNLNELQDSDKLFLPVTEKIYALDMNNEYQEINQLYINGVEDTLDIEMEDGSIFTCTPNHRFLVDGKGWIRADKLEENDDIKTFSTVKPTKMRVRSVHRGQKRFTVDVEVNNTHSYQLENGNVVHNTSSLTLGCSSGIHAWHSPYYIRHIRVGKNEAIYDYLSKYHPELVEDEYFRPQEQAVIKIPQKAPDSAVLRSESTFDFLERVKKWNVEWVKNGHLNGMNTHNVSATISIRNGAWDEVAEWMWKEKETFNGLSCLPYDDNEHTYIQAPFTVCDKETYEEMMKHLTKVDLTRIIENQDETDLAGEIACGPSGCEVI